MENDAHFQNFINETEDLLKNILKDLSNLSAGTDNRDIIGEIFRVIHTIKGNAGFFSLSNIKAAANAVEDILSAIRSGVLKVEKPVIDLLWNGVNIISLSIEQVKYGEVTVEPNVTEEVFLSDVKKMLSGCAAAEPEIISSKYRISDSVGYLCEKTDITRYIYIIKGFLEKAKAKNLDSLVSEKFVFTLNDLSGIFLKNKFESSAVIAKKMVSDFQTLINDDGQIDNVLANMLESDFRKIQDFIKEVDIRDVIAARREIRPPMEKIKPSFRVEKEKIDDILNTIYKLVSVKDDFGRFRDKISSGSFNGDSILDFQKNLNSFNFLLRDMLQMMIKIKVTSPRLLLEKMEQIVASLAQSCAKKIKINTVGKDIFAERSRIETLEKILPHILRNCIDHGIESPQERACLGKPEEGLISIEASKKGDSLLINISDDGRGIRLKPAVNNTASAPNNAGNDSGSKRNIFGPGITTADSVGELSGRGVGMDVVLRTLEQVGGEIEVFSEINKGTRFVITLPNAGVSN